MRNEQEPAARAALQRAFLVVLLATLAAAIVAQQLLDHETWFVGSFLAFGAAALFGISSQGVRIECHDSSAAVPQGWSARQALLLIGGCACALIGCVLLAPNEFTAIGTALWLGGIVVCLVACASYEGAALPERRTVFIPVLLGLIAIVAVGAYFRLHRLVDLPAEAGCDIPLKLQIVRGMLAGERPIFSTVYPGREVGFFYATALYGALFGADQAALKMVSVAFSLATLPLIYLLGARWFGRTAGLLAAAWLALSPWHITISRIGYRGVMTPFMVALTLWALDRALVRRAQRDWAWLGLAVGAGLYTYTAYAAVLLVLVVVAVTDVLRSPRRVAGWIVAVLFALSMLLPLLRFAGDDPRSFLARAGSRVTEGDQDYHLASRLLENATASVAMFNVRGDPIATQNTPGRRMLGAASGALFILGVGVALTRVTQPPWTLAVLALLALQLPSALVLAFPAEVPGAVRASGTLIPAYLLVGVPFSVIGGVARRRGSRATFAACVVFGAGLLLAEAGETWRRYFVEYAAAQPFGNYPMTRTIAAVMDEHAERGDAYVVAYPYWIDGNAVRMQLQRLPLARAHEVDPAAFDALLAQSPAAPLLFILKPDDDPRAVRLRAVFPAGEARLYRDRHDQVMFVAFRSSR